jgi:DnaJ-class molecular chaperone
MVILNSGQDRFGLKHCLHCHGTGRIPRSTCSHCHGSGTWLFFFDCRECNGRGYFPEHKCFMCNGTGQSPWSYPNLQRPPTRYRCPVCGGSGITQTFGMTSPCPRCHPNEFTGWRNKTIPPPWWNNR